MKSKEELKTKVFESLGTASMCWKETPTGIFDDTLAIKIGNELWAEIESFILTSSDEGRSEAVEEKDVIHQILEDFGCPQLSFTEEVTMYYPAIVSAMDEYATIRTAQVRDRKDEFIRKQNASLVTLFAENDRLKSELSAGNKRIEKLSFMVENGLGWDDMKDDNKYPSGL